MEVKLELIPTDTALLVGWQPKWQELEQRLPDRSIYSTYEWLDAWAKVYSPRSLAMIHAVTVATGETVALGLIEIDRIRGWRFAGGAQTPRRAPLSAPELEQDVWKALADWLRSHPFAWSTLDAAQVPSVAELLPGARLSETIVPCLAVPESFDDYLTSMSSRRRHEVRRRLRRADDAGVEVRHVATEACAGALADFVRICELRTDINKNQDERTLEFLRRVGCCPSIEVHVFEVLEGARRIGVSIDLVCGEVSYPYNLAWEPDSAHVAPGILLTLNTVKYASERGLGLINLGPGEQAYKFALGFVPTTQLTLHAVNPAVAGRALRRVGATYQRLRA